MYNNNVNKSLTNSCSFDNHSEQFPLTIQTSCYLCDYSSTNLDDLSLHMNNYHSLLSISNCDMCQLVFNSIDDLTLHMHVYHRESVASFQESFNNNTPTSKLLCCNLCQLFFLTDYDLALHYQYSHSLNQFALDLENFKPAPHPEINLNPQTPHSPDFDQLDGAMDINMAIFSGHEGGSSPSLQSDLQVQSANYSLNQDKQFKGIQADARLDDME